MYWCEEIDHERDGEEEANENEKHKTLVTALVLYHVKNEDEKEAEYSLLKKLIGCYEIEKHYYTVYND